MSLSKIKVLSDLTINQIAAGEVIENPSSVVKELVENAMDAGANEIYIEIQEGGRQSIRISDNGCGMSQDDALLCLERHATSKIRNVDDIESIGTMGFRGEAIPSIAAISKFSILTAPKDSPYGSSGTLIHVEGGKILSYAKAARSHGTTIEVKSLFFNVPVRRKFQKSPTYDVQEIVKILTAIALANPSINFEIISDHQTLFKTPIATLQSSFHEQLGKRIQHLLGKELFENLLPVSFKHSLFELKGFIGNASSHKPNRTGQHLFINQRSIFSPMIASTIREGYGTMLPTLRHPLAILHFDLPGHLVDVNVHPQKKEVRIREEFQFKIALIEAIQTTLRQGFQTEHPDPSSMNEQRLDSTIAWQSRPFSGAKQPNQVTIETKWEIQNNDIPFFEKPEISHAEITPSHSTFIQSRPSPLIQTKPSSLLSTQEFLKIPARVIETLVDFLIIDPFNLDPALFSKVQEKKEGGLALVDQRAAHSRIFFEHLLSIQKNHEHQALLIPLTLQLSKAESGTVIDHLSLLNQMGFGLRELGEQTFLVDSLPAFVKQQDAKTCLEEMIEDLSVSSFTKKLDAQKIEKLALAACRASTPKNKRLSIQEGQSLLNQLMHCKIQNQCPFGKPITTYIAPNEMEKWFGK